jgi:hypothetical protein
MKNLKNLLLVVFLVAICIQVVAQEQETWYVSQENYDLGFCVPAYINDIENITLLNGNILILLLDTPEIPPVVILDGDMFVPTVMQLEDGWKKVFIDSPLEAETFRWILVSCIILPQEELIFRDDLKKAIIIFKEAEDERDTFLIKVVPAVEGDDSNYSLEEVEEKDFYQRIIRNNGEGPIPVFTRK